MNRYKYFAITPGGEVHKHTLDGRFLNGTSTVTKVVAKEGLTWWASAKAVESLGWVKELKSKDLPGIDKAIKAEMIAKNTIDRQTSAKAMHEKIKLMNAAGYLDLLDAAYRAHKDRLDESADAGTDMHAELEKYVKFCMTQNGGVPTANFTSPHRAVAIFVTWSMDNIKKFLWSELHCYSEKLWLGGISDVGCELKDGSIAIVDFKSSKEVYFTQFIQAGGYDIQFSENGGFTPDGDKVFELPAPITAYAIFPFGTTNPKPKLRTEVDFFKDSYVHALALHTAIEDYNKLDAEEITE